MSLARISAFRVVCMLGVALGLLGPASAQEFRATLAGRVTDPQGAVVIGTRVVATHLETATAFETMSGAEGRYTLPLLPPGTYRVSAERDGFRRYVREGMVLRTAEKATIDIPLALGATAEELTVTADVAGIDRGESALSQTMENRRVAELPLNGRQVYMLMQLTSGTLFAQRTFGPTGFSGTRAWDVNGALRIHGGRTGNNDFFIDGAPNSPTGGWTHAPLVDAVEEFKVSAAAADASYGRTGGGVVQLTMKSGGNELHGAANWFHRSDFLDANTTQNNRNNIAKGGHDYNGFGAVLSGPVQKGKTFFMGYYEGFHELLPSARTVTVPTALQRSGDFSQTRTSAGQPILIYDPLTTRPDPNRPGRLVRDPFPGNKIPAGRMNPIALKLLQHVPLPNVDGDAMTGTNNFVASPNSAKYRYNSYYVRLDHRFSDRHRVYLSNTANWGVEFRNQNGFPPPATQGEWNHHRNHYMTTLDDVLTLNPTTLLNVRASFDRFVDAQHNEYARLTEDLGIETPFQVVEPQYPRVTVEGYQSFFPGTRFNNPNNIYAFTSTLTKTWSKHLFKVGADARMYRLNRLGLGDGNTVFDFSRGFTQRDPQQGEAIAGNGLASFLLGYPSGGGVDINATSAREYKYFAAFVQNDWKVTPRLTLNIGLRWDLQPPVTERYDRQVVGFDPDAHSSFRVPGLSLRGGPVFASVDGRGRSPHKTDYDNIQPRLGASYKVHERVIVKGHFGRSYLALTGAGQEGINQTGFSRRTGLVTSLQTGVPRTYDAANRITVLQRPFPDGIQEPFGASLGLTTAIGSGLSFINPEFEVPHADQFMIGVALELPRRTTWDIAYVGSRTRKLPIGRAINEVPLAEREKSIERLGGSATYLTTQVPSPFAGLVPGTGLNNATTSRGQLLRPYPQFGGITMDRENTGGHTYDALETTVKTRPVDGLLLVVNYTRMRLLEKSGYLNNGYDTEIPEILNLDDRTHNLVITGVWDLPFGKGRRYASGASGLLGQMISGWQLNTIVELRSGTPISMPGNGILRVDSPALPASERTLDRWFDNSTRTNPRPDGNWAWDVQAPNEFRTPPVRIPGVRNDTGPEVALSVFKNTRVGKYNVQARVEAFNALNTPIYGNPDTNPTSPRFGRVTPDQINFPRHVQLGLRVTF